MSYNSCLTVDVAILGSGPAGSALALLLRKANVHVATFSLPPRVNHNPAIPETLPPGACIPIRTNSLRPHYATVSAWGCTELATRHSICNPLGPGSFVDRSVFDHELAVEVEVIHAQLTSVVRMPTHWILEFADHPRLLSRIVVDASGRSGAFARLLGVQRKVLSPLVALTARAVPSNFPTGEALVESAEAGWWFSAPTPEGELSVSWFAYQDRIPFADALKSTAHTYQRVERLLSHSPIARPARTEWLLAPAGPGWLAVGDAAFASDPLGSQGLWCALEAAEHAAQLILNGSAHHAKSIQPYLDYYADCVKRFLQDRRSYYCMEQRWPNSPFWKATHAEVATR